MAEDAPKKWTRDKPAATVSSSSRHWHLVVVFVLVLLAWTCFRHRHLHHHAGGHGCAVNIETCTSDLRTQRTAYNRNTALIAVLSGVKSETTGDDVDGRVSCERARIERLAAKSVRTSD